MAVSGWVVSYDVSDDNLRRRVASTLQTGGRRLLYSVFELAVPDHSANGVISAAERLLAPGDRLLAVRCCGRCRQAKAGHRYEPLPRDGAVVV